MMMPWGFTTTLRLVRATGGEFIYDDHEKPWSTVARNLEIAVTSLPTTLIGTTRNATTFPGGDPPPPDPELGDCSGSIYGHTVWYKLKLLVDTIVTVDTTGSDFDTVLAVYEKTGPDFGGLISLGCNDDNIALESQVTFLAEAGKKYQIQVGGFAGDSGNLIISFSEGNPAGPAPAGPVEPVTKKKK